MLQGSGRGTLCGPCKLCSRVMMTVLPTRRDGSAPAHPRGVVMCTGLCGSRHAVGRSPPSRRLSPVQAKQHPCTSLQEELPCPFAPSSSATACAVVLSVHVHLALCASYVYDFQLSDSVCEVQPLRSQMKAFHSPWCAQSVYAGCQHMSCSLAAIARHDHLKEHAHALIRMLPLFAVRALCARDQAAKRSQGPVVLVCLAHDA
jgi:hypothetical protein